jgi:hypothetical protein
MNSPRKQMMNESAASNSIAVHRRWLGSGSRSSSLNCCSTF